MALVAGAPVDGHAGRARAVGALDDLDEFVQPRIGTLEMGDPAQVAHRFLGSDPEDVFRRRDTRHLDVAESMVGELRGEVHRPVSVEDQQIVIVVGAQKVGHIEPTVRMQRLAEAQFHRGARRPVHPDPADTREVLPEIEDVHARLRRTPPYRLQFLQHPDRLHHLGRERRSRAERTRHHRMPVLAAAIARPVPPRQLSPRIVVGPVEDGSPPPRAVRMADPGTVGGHDFAAPVLVFDLQLA